MERIEDKLLKIPLFKDLVTQPGALADLVQRSSTTRFQKDQVVFIESDRGTEMYIPLSGRYEIRKRTRAGDHYTVAILSADQPIFFGELALVDDERRSATVVATEEGECLVISRAVFEEWAKTNPAWALPVVQEIARVLASRLRKTTADMLTLFDALLEEIKG